MPIIPWKNVGKTEDENVNLFRIKWSAMKGEWVRDNSGKHWGYLERDGKIVQKKSPAPKSPNLSLKLSMGTPSLGVVDDKEKE